MTSTVAAVPQDFLADPEIGLEVEAAEVGLVVTDADGQIRVSDKRARTLLSWPGRAESFADLLERMEVMGERLARLLDEIRRRAVGGMPARGKPARAAGHARAAGGSDRPADGTG